MKKRGAGNKIDDSFIKYLLLSKYLFQVFDTFDF